MVAFDMWCQRKPLRFCWKKTEEVLERLRDKPSLEECRQQKRRDVSKFAYISQFYVFVPTKRFYSSTAMSSTP